MRRLLTIAFLVSGCAHVQPVAVGKCADRRVALEVAHQFASQTDQSEHLGLQLDEARVADEPDRWTFRTVVGQRRFLGGEATLVVRKGDCGTDWETVAYEM